MKLPAKIGGKDRVDLLPPTAGATLLVDADIVCYQGVMEPLVYREERHDTDWGEEWSFHLDADRAFAAISDRLQEMVDVLRGEGLVLCWGGPSNWRRKVLPEYKANRTTRKPLGYGSMRARLSEAFKSLSIPHLEADDVIGILSTQEPDKYVVVSEDKDMRTLPVRIWNPRTDEYVHQGHWEAAIAHLVQTLTGDTTDNYKGCPGVGAVTAKRELAKAKDLGDAWRIVVALYKKAGLDEREATTQARVAHILQHGEYDTDTGELHLWEPPKRKDK